MFLKLLVLCMSILSVPDKRNNYLIYPYETLVQQEKIIAFVGDSRFVGMDNAIESDDLFFAKVGEGYEYLISQEENILNSNADILIIGFGINDLYNVEKYVEYLNNKPFPMEIIFLTVNPVNEQKEKQYGYTVTNEQIDEFNNYIEENAEYYQVLDTNSYLMETTYETKDGIHYKNETYLSIYDFIIDYLNK